MKKFIYSFAVVAALGFVACGGNKNAEAVEEVVDSVAIETVDTVAPCCDSVCCDSVAPEAAPAV